MADLVEVHAIHEDALKDGYRSCDFCHETACEDIWAGREMRKFYHATDGSGLDVCENCVAKFEDDECA